MWAKCGHRRHPKRRKPPDFPVFIGMQGVIYWRYRWDLNPNSCLATAGESALIPENPGILHHVAPVESGVCGHECGQNVGTDFGHGVWCCHDE